MKNFKIPDINMYKVFKLNGKYGIKRWDGLLVLNPISLKRPDIVELEIKGYTFVVLEEGCNVVDKNGDLLIHNFCIQEIGWFKDDIVAFTDVVGNCGLFFINSKKIIKNITDAECEKHCIRTWSNEKAGLSTYTGFEIFPPVYYEPTVFYGDNIFIGYCEDGTSVLNAESWAEPIHAKAFKVMQRGIIMKSLEDEYSWIDLQTGKRIVEETLSRAQKQMLGFAKLVKSF